jgi:hypothetical protein
LVLASSRFNYHHQTGGYFELTKNLADVFENFVNGTTVGAPQVGLSVSGSY